MSKYFPTKLSELDLLSRVAGDDYALIVDKSDTFQSENGSTKRVTASTLRTYILSNFNFGSINNHSDVSIQNRVDGQLLRYNGKNAKWENWTHNFLTEEKDPVFSASDAAKIKSSDITNWDEAHGWGNHADEGYLKSLPSHKLTDHSDVDSKSETDGQLFRFNGTKKLWENWTHNFVTSQEADLSSVVRDTDFESAGLLKRGDTPGSYSVIADNSEKWNLAFDWGDHAQAGYLKNITNQGLGALSNVSLSATLVDEQLLRFDGTNWINWTPDFLKASDFSGSASSGIAQTDIDKWNTAYGWGDHAVEGYLTDITGESIGSLSNVTLSPTVSTGQLLRFDGTNWINFTHDFLTVTSFNATPASDITSSDVTNWNTAHGWGDHALAGYLTTETDPVFVASPSAGITTSNITDWNTAHGWGDHALAGYLTTETDPVFEASAAADITTANINGWNTTRSTVALGSGKNGSFTTVDGKTILVSNGIITGIL